MPTPHDLGWAWSGETKAVAPGPDQVDLYRAFARCFGSSEGDRIIGHLTKTFLHRRLGPEASDAELRQLEGQRCAVAYIIAMVERGRARPWPSIASEDRDLT
jgi:hypothetical protein